MWEFPWECEGLFPHTLLRSRASLLALNLATPCLGCEPKAKVVTIYMHQTKYIENKLQMFKLEMNKVVATPLEVGLKLTKAMFFHIESKKEHMKKVPYQSAIGSLIYYMICIRPDIAYSVGVMSQFFTYPREIHWKVVKRIFR
jgi:ATP-binding cassette subfamily B (MDR/TAP) protein 1